MNDQYLRVMEAWRHLLSILNSYQNHKDYSVCLCPLIENMPLSKEDKKIMLSQIHQVKSWQEDTDECKLSKVKWPLNKEGLENRIYFVKTRIKQCIWSTQNQNPTVQKDLMSIVKAL